MYYYSNLIVFLTSNLKSTIRYSIHYILKSSYVSFFKWRWLFKNQHLFSAHVHKEIGALS